MSSFAAGQQRAQGSSVGGARGGTGPGRGRGRGNRGRHRGRGKGRGKPGGAQQGGRKNNARENEGVEIGEDGGRRDMDWQAQPLGVQFRKGLQRCELRTNVLLQLRSRRKNVEVQRYGSEDSDKVRIEADEDCLICCKPLVYRAFGPCDHSGICSRCLLTQRLLYGDISCPLCKAENERIIVTSNKSRAHWSSFANSIFGETCGGDLIMDREWGAFFDAADRRHLEDIRALRGFACGVPGCDAKPQTLKALKAHLRSAHDRELCEVCVKAQRKFISEIGRYTSAELQVHLRRGIPSEGFNGHPACPFAKDGITVMRNCTSICRRNILAATFARRRGRRKFTSETTARFGGTTPRSTLSACSVSALRKSSSSLPLSWSCRGTWQAHPSIPYKRSINLKFNVGSGSTPQHSDSGATNDDAFDEFAFAYDPSGQISSSSSAVSSTVPAAAAAVRRPRAPVGEEQFPTLGDAMRQSSGSSAPQQHGSASRSWSSSVRGRTNFNLRTSNINSREDFPGLPGWQAAKARKSERETRSRPPARKPYRCPQEQGCAPSTEMDM